MSSTTDGQFSPAGNGDYAFLVQLVNLQDRSHRCLGTLIAPDMVLTAAHCLYDLDVLVQLGADPDHRSGRLFVVQAVRTSPEYYYNTYTGGIDVDPYDVALLQLYGNAAGSRATNSTPSLVKLNRNAILPRSPARLLGLGWNSSDPASTSAEATILTYVPNGRCANVSGTSAAGFPIDYRSQIIDVSLCALYRRGAGLCPGDSGGPLFLDPSDASRTNNPTWVQLGITSASFGCRDPVLPSLNVRISQVADWIDSVVCELSLYAPPADFGCHRNHSAYAFPTEAVELMVRLERPEESQWCGWILYQDVPQERRVPLVERPLGYYRGRSASSVASVIRVSDNRPYQLAVLHVSNGEFGTCDVQVLPVDSYSGASNRTYVSASVAPGNAAQVFPFVVGSVHFRESTQPPTSSRPTETSQSPYLTVFILLDKYPTETGFRVEALIREDNAPESATVLIDAVYPGTFALTQAQQQVEMVVPLLPSANRTHHYRFTMTDNEQDGLEPPALYEVWLGPRRNDSGRLIVRGGAFFIEDRTDFSIPQRYYSDQMPTPAPTSSSIVAPAPTERGSAALSPSGGNAMALGTSLSLLLLLIVILAR